LQSDDEDGEGTYNLYRTNASDEEEYDEDTAAWSEDDMDTRHPWKRNVWEMKSAHLGDEEF